jgi:hypothetical protein
MEWKLEGIDAIPDSDVLEAGHDATIKWLEDNGYHADGVTTLGFGIPKEIKCAWSITELILGSVAPIGKLLKIKNLIKALGGVKKAAELLRKGVGGKWLIVGGQALYDLAMELTGIADIKKWCLS